MICVQFVCVITRHHPRTKNKSFNNSVALPVDCIVPFQTLIFFVCLNDVDDFLKLANGNRCVMQYRCNVDYDGFCPTASISQLHYDERSTQQKQSLNACRHKQYTLTRHMTYCYRTFSLKCVYNAIIPIELCILKERRPFISCDTDGNDVDDDVATWWLSWWW